MREDEFLTVGDHDFTLFSLIPSVIFMIDIPEYLDPGTQVTILHVRDYIETNNTLLNT